MTTLDPNAQSATGGSGGFLGMGHTLYAIPWSALTLDAGEKCFRHDVSADRIKNTPGFDKDHWPAMSGPQWGSSLHEYYNQQPYWRVTGGAVEGRTLDL